MRIAIVTFDGFNEIDSFVALRMLFRVHRPDWTVAITCPAPVVTSAAGVRVERQQPLGFARDADVVLIGSGVRTLDIVADAELMAELRFDPARQVLASQCSGALVLAKLGHLRGIPASTDQFTRPWVLEAGASVLDQPFHVAGNIATAGGCLASHYLATWIIARALGRDTASEILSYVAPVGEEADWNRRAFAVVAPYL